jgi:hypothetical protein
MITHKEYNDVMDMAEERMKDFVKINNIPRPSLVYSAEVIEYELSACDELNINRYKYLKYLYDNGIIKNLSKGIVNLYDEVYKEEFTNNRKRKIEKLIIVE